MEREKLFNFVVGMVLGARLPVDERSEMIDELRLIETELQENKAAEENADERADVKEPKSKK